MQAWRIAQKVVALEIFEWYIERFGSSWNLPDIFANGYGDDMQLNVSLGTEGYSEDKLAANRIMCSRTAWILETYRISCCCT